MINYPDKDKIENFVELTKPKILKSAVKTFVAIHYGKVSDGYDNIIKKAKIKPDLMEYLLGYVDGDGKFYTEKEAIKWIKKYTPNVYANLEKITDTKNVVKLNYNDYLKATGLDAILNSNTTGC